MYIHSQKDPEIRYSRLRKKNPPKTNPVLRPTARAPSIPRDSKTPLIEEYTFNHTRDPIIL